MPMKIGGGKKPQYFERSTGFYGDDDKFTNGGAKEYRQNTPYEEILRENNRPEKAYGFANKERKNTAHHRAHAKDMGFKNQDEYEREACRFFNSNQGELYYSERRKRYYRYDEKKGWLVTSNNGIIHTFIPITKKKMIDKVKEDGLWKILL